MLGEFAADEGSPHPLCVAAAAFAAVATFCALWRPLLRLAGRDPSWATGSAVFAGVAGVALALAGLYVTSTRGRAGASLARLALGFAAVAGIGGFAAGAILDGVVSPGRFFQQYFDGEILRTLPGDFARGLVNTVKLAVVAQVFAMVLGLVIATFALSPSRLKRLPAVAYVDVVRGLPLVVLTFLIHFGLPNIGITLGDFTSPVVILSVNASAYVAEIFRAGIQSVPKGQMEAARSLGMSQQSAMMNVVIPQAARAVIPPLVSEFIALIKDVAIVIALIGFTPVSRDLFGAASQAAASTFSPTPYMAVALVYLSLTIPLARVVGRLERRVRANLS